MRILATALAYIVSLALVGIICFFGVLAIAGPHAGILPGFAEAGVILLGWLTVIALPVMIARKVWRRYA